MRPCADGDAGTGTITVTHADGDIITVTIIDGDTVTVTIIDGDTVVAADSVRKSQARFIVTRIMPQLRA